MVKGIADVTMCQFDRHQGVAEPEVRFCIARGFFYSAHNEWQRESMCDDLIAEACERDVGRQPRYWGFIFWTVALHGLGS